MQNHLLRSDATLFGTGEALVSEKLWEVIEPVLPKEPPEHKGGKLRVPNWVALTGIIFTRELDRKTSEQSAQGLGP